MKELQTLSQMLEPNDTSAPHRECEEKQSRKGYSTPGSGRIPRLFSPKGKEEKKEMVRIVRLRVPGFYGTALFATFADGT